MKTIFKNRTLDISCNWNEIIDRACFVDEEQLMTELAIDEDYERCVQLRREAEMLCLLKLHDHIKVYLDENLNLWWKYRLAAQGLDSSSTSSFSCNYEGWIRECHPENVKDDDSSVEFDESLKEHRFYLEDSDHRRIWNEYVEIYGCPQLKVEARAIERLQSKQYVN
mmetsp:Transcript_18670/g.22878  ORF Transcript_18670/g.22878 Transcript_18670/m.22878 type:complete len:167 (+) Transcript_18670:66-566(+)